MRILFIAPDPIENSRITGTTLIVQNLFANLCSHHEITIKCYSELIEAPASFSQLLSPLRTLSLILKIISPRSYKPIYSISNQDLVQASSEFDNIVIFREDLLFLVLQLALLRRTNILFYAIDYFPLLYSSLSTTTGSLGFIYYRLEQIKSLFWNKLLSRFAITTVYVSSVDTASALSDTKNPKILTITNGISVEPASRKIHKPSNAYNILFSGDMRYKPNLQAFSFITSDIAPILACLDKPLIVYIVGRGLIPSTYSCLDSPYVTIVITGSVPSITDYFLLADLYLSPLFSGSGIKNKILSALYLKVPVLSTSLSFDGITNACGNIHYSQCNAKSPIAWSFAIKELLLHPEQRRLYSENGCGLISEQYTWGKASHDLDRALSVRS